MYSENNVALINDSFKRWGFDGFLLHDYDPDNGQVKINPGFHSGDMSKQDLFTELKQYIEVHGMRERHLGLLEECMEIDGLHNMTKYDLFTACGACLLGLKSQYSKFLNYEINGGSDGQNHNTIDYGDFVFGK